MRIRRLTPKLRKELKTPLGLLIRGSSEETTKALKGLIEKMKPRKIISVGDVVSKNMIRAGIRPQVLVVDNKVMRMPIDPIEFDVDQTLHVKNPPGTLMDAAWRVVKEAMKSKGTTKVMVDGEEDLLTLVVVLGAPRRSLVVYGQPDEGVVVVNVTEKTIGRVLNVIDEMEVCP
jgi:uncharacterized protein (UPF0218 family)